MKLSPKSAKILAHNISRLEYIGYRKGAVNNILQHIDYLRRQISENQTLIERVQTLTPGDLFVWHCILKWTKEPSPAIIQFNYISESNRVCISIVACDIKFSYRNFGKHLVPGTSENPRCRYGRCEKLDTHHPERSPPLYEHGNMLPTVR